MPTKKAGAEAPAFYPYVLPHSTFFSLSGAFALVVVLQPEVRDQFLALDVAQRVLHLDQLDEEVVLGIESRRGHRRLEVEAHPLLDADALQLAAARRQVEEQHDVQRQRGRQY